MKQKPETAGTIHFYGTIEQPATEVLRLSRDGIWANPDVPADDAAKAVLAALDFNIKLLVERVVQDEREACAEVCDDMHLYTGYDCAIAIRARGKA